MHPDGGGILIQFVHSTSGQPRMVFSMSFMTEDDLAREEEEIGGEMVELEEVRMWWTKCAVRYAVLYYELYCILHCTY